MLEHKVPNAFMLTVLYYSVRDCLQIALQYRLSITWIWLSKFFRIHNFICYFQAAFELVPRGAYTGQDEWFYKCSPRSRDRE